MQASLTTCRQPSPQSCRHASQAQRVTRAHQHGFRKKQRTSLNSDSFDDTGQAHKSQQAAGFTNMTACIHNCTRARPLNCDNVITQLRYQISPAPTGFRRGHTQAHRKQNFSCPVTAVVHKTKNADTTAGSHFTLAWFFRPL